MLAISEYSCGSGVYCPSRMLRITCGWETFQQRAACRGSGFGFGFKVQGFGFRVWGLGCGVWGVTAAWLEAAKGVRPCAGGKALLDAFHVCRVQPLPARVVGSCRF